MKRQNFLTHLLAVFIFVFGFSQSSDAQNRTDRILLDEAHRITRDEFPVFTTTPKGVRVYAVNWPSPAILNAIDRGLTELFAIARGHHYRQRLSFSDYTIFIAAADRTNDADKNYSPDLAVPAGQYAGSVYDQGGFIYAAGMVIAYNPCAFVIAEHRRDYERVSDVVRFEGEHLVLYHNDRRLFRETADHSAGGGHPILP